MDRSTAPARVPVELPTPADVVDQATQEPEPPPRLALAPPFPAPTQVTLPIRADGKRGSDRIRFRIWQDPRLTGLVQTVLLVISEFVNQAHAARLKGKTIAECAHKSVERCLKAANIAADLGVLAIDRRSHHRRYVFQDSWLRWFGVPTEAPERHDVSSSHRSERHDVSSSHRSERHDVSSSHDTTFRRVTGEPVQVNRRTYARPGPQAGGAAVPRTSTACAEAAAQGRPAATLDLDALIERDQQQAEAAHRAKVDRQDKSPAPEPTAARRAQADGRKVKSPKIKSPTKIKTGLVMVSSEGGVEAESTATPRPTVVEKSPDDHAFGYTDEDYRADEAAWLARQQSAKTAASRCAECGYPAAGTACPKCGAGNSAGRPSADTTAGGDA